MLCSPAGERCPLSCRLGRRGTSCHAYLPEDLPEPLALNTPCCVVQLESGNSYDVVLPKENVNPTFLKDWKSSPASHPSGGGSLQYISSSDDDDDTPSPAVASIIVVLPTMNLQALLPPLSPSPSSHAAGGSSSQPHPGVGGRGIGRRILLLRSCACPSLVGSLSHLQSALWAHRLPLLIGEGRPPSE